MTAIKTDAEIQQAVLRELAWDPRVDETDVGVEVDRGIVTLTGTVSTWAKRVAAQEAAHRVVGVLDVANDVVVKIPGDRARTDTDIAQAVRHALEWDTLVPDDRVRSTVSNGWVTLEGEVGSWAEREDAERAVQNLAGVRGVTDRMTVCAPRPPEPDRVRMAIEEALERRADREARRLQVKVTPAGTVKLTGRVRTWADKRATLAAARFTPGVRAVEDHLEINPGSQPSPRR
jgi:osmotically-inducible protein OsmY